MNHPTLEERILAAFSEIIERLAVEGIHDTEWREFHDKDFAIKELKQFLSTTIQEVREEERGRILAALPKYDQLVAAAEGAMDDETRLLKIKAIIQANLLEEIRTLINPPKSNI